MLTLTRTRAAAARLLANRAEAAALRAEADALTLTLRDALPHWGPVATGNGRSVFIAAGSLRKGWDADALATLARAHGATDAEIDACRKVTATAPAVRDRTTVPDDK